MLPKQTSALLIGITALIVVVGLIGGDRLRRPAPVPTFAFIPEAAGTMLSELEHLGAKEAAEKLRCHVYWNAPTSETDVAGQISLVDKVGSGKTQAVVVSPNHTLAVLTPLRHALEAGFPVVVISALLDLAPSAKLGYVVNDDEKMGELAAAEVGKLVHGKGSVMLVGIGRYAPGVMSRVRAAERILAAQFPGITVVSRVPGAYNIYRAEELTASSLDVHPGLHAVLSFTATATRGAHAAIKNRSLQKSIFLVGCEQDSDLMNYLASGEIAAILAEDTYRMGYRAVELIAGSLAGKQLPPKTVVSPVLITKQNLRSEEALRVTNIPK